MKEIIGPLEAARRLTLGQLGRRERIVDAIRETVNHCKLFFRREPQRRIRPYVPIPDSHFYLPPQRSMEPPRTISRFETDEY